jgi:hypothetical protein
LRIGDAEIGINIPAAFQSNAFHRDSSCSAQAGAAGNFFHIHQLQKMW